MPGKLHSTIITLTVILFAMASLLPLQARQPGDSASPPEKTGTSEKKKKQTRVVRLLAVGEVPVFRATLRNGVLREAEPKPGSLPPLEVVAALDDEKPQKTRVMLGSISPPLHIPQSLRTLRLFEAGTEANNAAPWATAPLPEGAEPLLVVLWRDPGTGKWTKARSLVLPDGPAAFPPRSLRVVNITPGLVVVRFGKEPKSVALRPGRSVLRKTTPGTPLPVAIAMSDGKGGWIRLYQGQANPASNERIRIFVHRSDGEEIRRPAKAVVITERIR